MCPQHSECLSSLSTASGSWGACHRPDSIRVAKMAGEEVVCVGSVCDGEQLSRTPGALPTATLC